MRQHGAPLLIEPGKRVGIFSLAGEMDLSNASLIAELDVPRGCSAVMLELARVTFMDGSGVAAICRLAQRLGPGGRLTLAHPSPSVARILNLTRVGDTQGIVLEP